ncbi:MAG: hypothetical protein JXA90_17145 [Planctomycetes bacterium]|nr:hypothetical protein [Planctomycetota bacterium]
MSGDTVLASLATAVRCLDELGVPYAIIGGAAMPAWGRIRATEDAGVLIFLDAADSRERRAAIVDALRRAGFAHMERADRRRVEDKEILFFWFPVRPQGFSIRLDLLLVEDARYKGVFDRAVTRRIDGLESRVASCEDLVALKLAAGRPVDIADARELLEINRGTIDRAALAASASSLECEAELATMLRDLGW